MSKYFRVIIFQNKQKMSFDIDAVLEKLRNFQYPTENELKKICNLVKSILIEESNIQPVSTPIVVCGISLMLFFTLVNLFILFFSLSPSNLN